MLNKDAIETRIKSEQANRESKSKLLRAYRSFAESDHGKVILADLIDFCGQNSSSVCERSFNNDQTNYSEGKRRVWLRINGLITEAKDGLD